MRRSSNLVMLASTIALGGCAVGMVRVSLPERSPPTSAPPLTQRISFDVCLPPASPPPAPGKREAERRSAGTRISEALALAGIAADLTDTPGAPVRFTVTPSSRADHEWSGLLSLFTFSVVPGYVVERKGLDVSLAWRDPAGPERHEDTHYEYRSRTFVWAPLVVYPDFFVGLNGGWAGGADAREKAGFERMIGRLADDLRARLAAADPGSPPGEVTGVTCPSESGGPSRAGSRPGNAQLGTPPVPADPCGAPPRR